MKKPYACYEEISEGEFSTHSPCLECSKIYTNIYELEIHRLEEHTKNGCVCKECRTFHGNIGHHLRNKHSEEYKLAKQEGKIKEMYTTDMVCKFCKKEDADRKDLVLHIKRVHLSRPLKCTYCFVRVAANFLEQHIKDNHAEALEKGLIVYTVDMNKYYPAKSSDELVITTESNPDNEAIDEIPELVPDDIEEPKQEIKEPILDDLHTKCPECNKVVTKKYLKTHIKRVHKTELIECEECKKKIKPGSLKLHMENVHGSYTFPCKTCHTTYKSQGALNHHYKTIMHQKTVLAQSIENIDEEVQKIIDSVDITTLERQIYKDESIPVIQLSCSFCNINISSKEEYISHMQSIHNSTAKIYMCNLCHAQLSSTGAVTTHVNDVHTKCKLKCPLCFSFTNYAEFLSKHLPRCARASVFKKYPGASQYEQFVSKYLIDRNINHIRQYKDEGLKIEYGSYLPYDVYFPTINGVLEIHGKQHYETHSFSANTDPDEALAIVLQHDRIKSAYAGKHYNHFIIMDTRSISTYELVEEFLDIHLAPLLGLVVSDDSSSLPDLDSSTESSTSEATASDADIANIIQFPEVLSVPPAFASVCFPHQLPAEFVHLSKYKEPTIYTDDSFSLASLAQKFLQLTNSTASPVA